MRGEDARNSGVHYLEYEPLEVEVRGKVWKVFGSPVSSIASGVVTYEFTHLPARLLHDIPLARFSTRTKSRQLVRVLSWQFH